MFWMNDHKYTAGFFLSLFTLPCDAKHVLVGFLNEAHPSAVLFSQTLLCRTGNEHSTLPIAVRHDSNSLAETVATLHTAAEVAAARGYSVVSPWQGLPCAGHGVAQPRVSSLAPPFLAILLSTKGGSHLKRQKTLF